MNNELEQEKKITSKKHTLQPRAVNGNPPAICLPSVGDLEHHGVRDAAGAEQL
jgi:hypothetical protein